MWQTLISHWCFIDDLLYFQTQLSCINSGQEGTRFVICLNLNILQEECLHWHFNYFVMFVEAKNGICQKIYFSFSDRNHCWMCPEGQRQLWTINTYRETDVKRISLIQSRSHWSILSLYCWFDIIFNITNLHQSLFFMSKTFFSVFEILTQHLNNIMFVLNKHHQRLQTDLKQYTNYFYNGPLRFFCNDQRHTSSAY